MEINLGASIFQAFIWLILLGGLIYLYVLIFKLVNRGIKALDIYIKKNESRDS